jgi:hypothetical protein
MEHGFRRSIRVAGVAGVAAAVVVALLIVGPLVTRSPGLVAFAGAGSTVTGPQHLADGWYAVSWTVDAPGPPANGCVFGLRLDQVAIDASPDPRERPFTYLVQKLAYRFVPAGGRLVGSSDALLLLAGDYDFIVDGSCRWQVLIAPTAVPSLAPPPASSDQ